MDPDTIEKLRAQMLAEIAAEVHASAPVTGRAELGAHVLNAMNRVPRHEFVPVELRPFAYANTPLPIGRGKTISQPFIVALMTDLLELEATDVVLEIGTGFGYQAAVLGHIARRVHTVERIEELAQGAIRRFSRLKYGNIQVKIGNGYYGWPEHAPFDKIMVTTAPDLIPPPLIAQLKPGGRMAIPTGIPGQQQLLLVLKSITGRIETHEVLPVRFSELDEGGEVAHAG